MPLSYNKVCEFEDFADPALQSALLDVFPHEQQRYGAEFPRGREYRKYWEVAMSVRALRDFGKLDRNSMILGVGAGTEATVFYLTNHCKAVFATDIYLNSGNWGDFAPSMMVWDPRPFAPYPFDEQRLIVQQMDGTCLHYPNSFFEGVFSSGSIEHFGGLLKTANSAYEMGRVLKTGGILTLSTEFCVSGENGGIEWPGLILFSAEQLRKYIVEASGLELVDELKLDISDATRRSTHPFSQYVEDLERNFKLHGRSPKAGEIEWTHYPHILVEHECYMWTSVHITLRKSDQYPLHNNDWARPDVTQQISDNSKPLVVSAEQFERVEQELQVIKKSGLWQLKSSLGRLKKRIFG